MRKLQIYPKFYLTYICLEAVYKGQDDYYKDPKDQEV